jgi:hypothetical protein
MFDRYPSLAAYSLSHFRFIKAYKLKPFFGSNFISLYRANQIYSQYFCYIHTVSCHHIQGQPLYNVNMVKRIQKRVRVRVLKEHTYLIVWYISSSSTSAARGTTRSPVVDVRCILYPKTHYFV